MPRRKLALCVSTSKPSSSLIGAGGGGGSIAMLCPHTGTILSSLRTTGDNAGKTMLGISSISMFPDCYTALGPPLMIAYGGTARKKDDTYGMLLSLRPASLPPLLHWKCRLPESQLSSGLIVSPCGGYIVGGGASGTCFVWKALGGTLLRSFKAHYRSVTCMAWSGDFLVTASADVVHLFSLLDLVDGDSRTTTTVHPLRTWSIHHLPVTALISIPSDRMVSASQDGQVAVLELFSQNVVCSIQMPHAIRALAHCNGRLYCGAVNGSIYMVDLDLYAAHQTAQLGVTIKPRDATPTITQQVFGSSQVYKTELVGHEKPISSLAVWTEDGRVWLASGDDAGQVRLWDTESRGCVRVIRPWSTKATDASSKTPSLHPVTSIRVVARGEENDQGTSFGKQEGSKKTAGIVTIVTPLQRYTDRPSDTVDEMSTWTPVPFLQPKRDRQSASLHDTMSTLHDPNPKRHKTAESIAAVANNGAGDEVDAEEPSQEVLRLRKELQEAKSTIARWEDVNNKLLAKLNKG